MKKRREMSQPDDTLAVIREILRSNQESIRDQSEMVVILRDVTSTLDDIKDFVKYNSNNNIDKEHLVEANKELIRYIKKLGGRVSANKKQTESEISILAKELTEKYDNVAKTIETEINSIELALAETRSSIDAYVKGNIDLQKEKITSTTADRKSKRDMIVKIILGLCTAGGGLYFLLQQIFQ